MDQQFGKTAFIENQSTGAARENIVTDTVSAKDGASIRYLQLGRGPGIVMLHGAMESARSHLGLAQALADAFTVYLPERRGHNLSVPFREDYSIQKE